MKVIAISFVAGALIAVLLISGALTWKQDIPTIPADPAVMADPATPDDILRHCHQLYDECVEAIAEFDRCDGIINFAFAGYPCKDEYDEMLRKCAAAKAVCDLLDRSIQ